jgi:hypothetical protein
VHSITRSKFIDTSELSALRGVAPSGDAAPSEVKSKNFEGAMHIHSRESFIYLLTSAGYMGVKTLTEREQGLILKMIETTII